MREPGRPPPPSGGKEKPAGDPAAAPGRLDLDELLRHRPERRLRRLPGLLLSAVRLASRAAPRELLLSTMLQAAAGAGLAGQLMVGRRLLASILSREHPPAFRSVLPELVILGMLSVLVSFADTVRGELQRLLGDLVGRYSTARVLEVAAAVELLDFDQPEFTDALQRATVNAQVRPVQVVAGLLGLVGSVAALIGLNVVLFALSPWFVALVPIAYVPSWLAASRGSRILHRFTVEQTEPDRRRSYLLNILSRREEAAEMRSFGLARFLARQHDDLYDQRIDGLRVVVGRRLRLALRGQVLTTLLTACALAALVWMYTSGHLTAASAGAIAVALLLMASRLGALVSSAGALYESSLFLEDFTTFIDVLPGITRSGNEAPPAPARFSKLVAAGVTFTYPARASPSLREVSLEIGRGEVVALVGENGSGKSTLAKVLAGLYVPDSGSVLWDGADVRTWVPEQLRSSVAVIFQDFVRYHLTAGDNISLGRHERSGDEEAIGAAAREAGAHDFLSTLPRGYDTQLGPQFRGGTDLSGGQWQRVALARALFRNAPFVILDEPTAALDARAERDLFDGIRRIFADRSVLLISHRFANVRSADRIYVLKDGQVVEQGTHAELMAADRLYAEMFSLQAASYLDTP